MSRASRHYRLEWITPQPEREAGFPRLLSQARGVWRDMGESADHPLGHILRALRDESDLALMRAIAQEMLLGAEDVVLIGMGGSALAPDIFRPFARGAARFHLWETPDPRQARALFSGLNPKTTRLVAISRSGATPETLEMMSAAHQWRERGARAKDDMKGVAISIDGATPLRELAARYGWRSVFMPDGINSRFSLFTSSAMLPAMMMGLDVSALRAAALEVASGEEGVARSAAELYFTQGKIIHVLCPHGVVFAPLALWWRQIWAESLARGGEGFTPIVAPCPADQHSQFQLYLDGPPDKFFTQLVFKDDADNKDDDEDEDFAALHRVMNLQKRIVSEGLSGAGRPLRRITVRKPSAPAIAALATHFMLELFLFAALIERDPFGQEAVETQKTRLRRHVAKAKRGDEPF